VLARLAKPDCHWTTFVATRVTKIRESTEAAIVQLIWRVEEYPFKCWSISRFGGNSLFAMATQSMA